MTDSNCIFCKIANGDIPSFTLYEDEDFRVILDASPSSTGHSLILPKSHAEDIFSLDDSIAAKALPLAKKMAAALKSVLNCDGLNILQNNGEAAGQTVHHYHIHIIPRYESDEVRIGWSTSPINKEGAPEFVKKVKLALNN